MDSTNIRESLLLERHSHLSIGKFYDFLEKNQKIKKISKTWKMAVPFYYTFFSDVCRVHFWTLLNHTLSGKNPDQKYYFFMEKFNFENVKFGRISWNPPSSYLFSRRASFALQSRDALSLWASDQQNKIQSLCHGWERGTKYKKHDFKHIILRLSTGPLYVIAIYFFFCWKSPYHFPLHFEKYFSHQL